MPAISLRGITCRFDGTTAVDDVTLDIEGGSLLFLLGPSGCGKTTLLRTIAGFHEPAAGRVLLGDRDITALPPERREAGMVFQGYALWPHMSVLENVAFGLEVRRVPVAERRRRALEALDLVHMADLAERRPGQLSGGQQQRVALARAIVFRPRVLLLDEPLSNLDAALRLEMRNLIRRIRDEVRMTTVYVTHDQSEALSLADAIAVMRQGRVVQRGTPQSLYRRPASRFVAEFMGRINLLPSTVLQAGPQGGTLRTAVGDLACDACSAPQGAAVLAGIRPESLRIVAEGPIRGLVRRSVYLGEMAQHEVETAAGTLLVLEQDPGRASRAGETLALQAARDAVIALTD
ncbi:MAG: ABC transporter ATP-binding protein [Planctomycetes bacterium]|nr:ABC transporter ATP-binding protein [Planctomycetota bacterium]